MRAKTLAILEVIVVAFVLVPLATLGIYRLLPGFEAWQTDAIGFPFPVFVDVVMIALAFSAIFLRRRNLVDYGISGRNFRYHLDIAGACFIPFVIAGMPLGMGVDHTSWSGALILATIQVGLLFLLGWILRKKSSFLSAGATATGLLLLAPGLNLTDNLAWKALILFITYALFVGFGEEIFYRGYVQSRLNEVFGKPYRFFDVAFGWGAMITALLFGLTHVGILRWILGLSTDLTLAWGFWTIFGGLVFGLVREKSGSILAPALLHGLPQAIASAVMLFI